ncbi:dehydrogenase reductase SDR family member 2 [Seiridium cupressi]
MAPSYTLSKIFGQVLMQAIAAGVDRKRMQIVSFHPGVILSETVRNGGYTEDSPVDWDSVDLPGQFAVWAATEQAAFLHGRFAWAAWDVDELRAQMLRTEDEDNLFLTIGVRGI